MSIAFVRRPNLPSSVPWRSARTLVAAGLVVALGVAGYPGWRWLVAGDAFERVTGMHLDAQLRFSVRLVPAARTTSAPFGSGSPGAPSTRSFRLGAGANLPNRP